VTPRLLSAVLVAVATTACASTGAVPRPFPLPGGPAVSRTPPRTSSSPDGAASTTADGYSISSTALSLRGAPYRNGGVDPAGFDCSGLVKYVFEQHGVAMPREARQQFQIGHPVEPSALEPGDLVFFTTVAPGPSHVGILVGGDQFVHAPTTNGVVRVESLSSQYWSSRFIGAKRVN
jgi:cell wall-associated NlpC family hydrolase